MNSLKKYIPDGTQDILFKECKYKIDIEGILRKCYSQCGFLEVITPTLEFYDVFNSENQPIEQEKMYKFFDNHGRIMVLRPDMTTPICRIAATKLKESIYPLKLCYTSNIFRVNENWNAKMSEFTQSGIEIIGIDNYRADAEGILMAIKALKAVGLKDFKVELGQAEFFKALIEDIDITDDEIESLRKLVENKNFIALKEFLDVRQNIIDKNTLNILKKLPELFGGIEVLNIAKNLTNNKKALKALTNINEVYNIIDKIGLSNHISIDLGMVHHINYYTGIIFRGYVDEIGTDILSGGRYDNLVEQFGMNLSATGFAINVDSILLALDKQGKLNKNLESDFVVYYENESLASRAYDVSDKLRENGYQVEISLFECEKNTVEYSKQKGISIVLSLIDNVSVKVYDIVKNNEYITEIEKLIELYAQG